MVEKELKKVYKRGLKERGTKAYNPLILFKMQLVLIWYNLSDVQTEDMVNDSFSVMRFCGLKIEDPVPDHSTLSRFRNNAYTEEGIRSYFEESESAIDMHKLIVANGKAKVDASLTESPFSPNGVLTYEVVEDRKEDESSVEEQEKEEAYYKAKKVEQPN